MGSVTNVKIKPHNAIWGENVYQVQKITTRADVAKDLNNDYFVAYTPSNVKHYFWFNVNSEGVDPAIAGATAHEVVVATGATADAVAVALEAVIDAVSGFDCTVSSNVITVTNSDYGYASFMHEGVGTSFTFELVTLGNTSADVGYIDGDIEVTMAEDLVDVTAHQTGTNVLGQIRTGKQIEVVLNFKETNAANLKKVLTSSIAASFMPNSGTASELIGVGFNKDFTNTMDSAAKLVLHPISKATGDHSEDVTFFYAYPMLENLTFSGENIATIPVTFKIYPKLANDNKANYFVIGDSTQTF